MLSGEQARLDIAGGDDCGSGSAQRPRNVESNCGLILHQQDQSSGQRSVLHKIAPGRLLTETGQTQDARRTHHAIVSIDLGLVLKL